MATEHQNTEHREHDQDGHLIKRPMKGSFKRVGDQIMKEMDEKSPSEAIRDDFTGDPEPTDAEREHLDHKVDEARNR